MADLLALTLPYNRHHFAEVCVVSRPGDKTVYVAWENDATPFLTDAFYEDGASFNKWRALEEGLDSFGRHGWLVLIDPDVLWWKQFAVPYWKPAPGKLYTPLRRMFYDLPKLRDGVPPEATWPTFPLHPQQREFAGYTQIFHAEDPHLGPPPWHETDWRHAGGADSFFQRKWPESDKVRPPFEVLHLGPSGVNWCGRAMPYLDGTVPSEADARRRELLRLVSLRRRGAGDPFAAERLERPS